MEYQKKSETDAVLRTYEFAQILVSEIDLARPDWHGRRQSGSSSGKLRKSIAAVGIIQPLLVCSTGDGSFRVIDGVARLEAASELGMTEVPALIVSGTPDELELCSAAVNMDWGSLQPIEMGWRANSLVGRMRLTQRAFGEAVGKSSSVVGQWKELAGLIPVESFPTGRRSALLDRGRRKHFRFIAAGGSKAERQSRFEHLSRIAAEKKSLNRAVREMAPAVDFDGSEEGPRDHPSFFLATVSWMVAGSVLHSANCAVKAVGNLIDRVWGWMRRVVVRPRRTWRSKLCEEECEQPGPTSLEQVDKVR